MTFQHYLPHPALRDYFDRYFIMQTDEHHLPVRELVVPDGTHGILLVQREAIKRSGVNDQSQVQHLAQSHVFGQKSDSVIYNIEQRGLDCFGVKVRPGGLSVLTGISESELSNAVVEAETLLKTRIRELENQVFEAKTVAEKINCVDRFFLAQISKAEPTRHQLVNAIIKFIHEHRGQLSVQTIAHHFSLSYKKLERLFAAMVGLSPKVYCRIIRFNATLYFYHRHPEYNLTELAYAAGYYDQMHFIKDVKYFSNQTPKDFFTQKITPIESNHRSAILERLS